MKYCGYCGKQLEDKATHCNSCGAQSESITPIPANDENLANTALEFTYNGIRVDLEEIINKNGKNKISAIKELRALTGIDIATGKRVIDEAYLGKLYSDTGEKIKPKNSWGCLVTILLAIIAIIAIRSI